MRRIATRVALGAMLVLIVLMPLGPLTGRSISLLPACAELAFSTEEDFVTKGPEPSDGNPIISDGDLLGLVTDATGAMQCVVCARNIDLLGNTFGVSVDLGLDAADVIDAEGFLVAFSTELDSPPNAAKPFTAGDLLATNGAVIPNTALTDPFDVGYDIGLDAVHFVGSLTDIKRFLEAVKDYAPDDWLVPGQLAGLLQEYQIDLWFSTEGTLGPVTGPKFLDGDLLSARSGGAIVATNKDLLPAGVPAGIPTDGVDFGLDAVTSDRVGEEKTRILFSTEILYNGEISFTDGDVLRYNNGVVHTNGDLINCFEPAAGFLGLDALHIASEEQPSVEYLPLIQRQYR